MKQGEGRANGYAGGLFVARDTNETNRTVVGKRENNRSC